MSDVNAGWTLTDAERATLAVALDALLPAEGSFPWPSATTVIDFFLQRVSPAGTPDPEWPGIDAGHLRTILARLAGRADLDAMTAALEALERDEPDAFLALWRLAVYGYYSRPEVIAAVARDHAPAYHGAPLPLGYAHVLGPWDAENPLEYPQKPRGRYIATADVRRVDLDRLRVVQEREVER